VALKQVAAKLLAAKRKDQASMVGSGVFAKSKKQYWLFLVSACPFAAAAAGSAAIDGRLLQGLLWAESLWLNGAD